MDSLLGFWSISIWSSDFGFNEDPLNFKKKDLLLKRVSFDTGDAEITTSYTTANNTTTYLHINSSNVTFSADDFDPTTATDWSVGRNFELQGNADDMMQMI